MPGAATLANFREEHSGMPSWQLRQRSPPVCFSYSAMVVSVNMPLSGI